MVDPDKSGYVEVVVDIPALGDRRFTYEVPGGCHLPYGAKVEVPFGGRQAEAYVVGHSTHKPDLDLKPVAAAYDLRFLPPHGLLSLGEVLKDYYLASTASFWRYLWPPSVRKQRLKSDTKFGHAEQKGPDKPVDVPLEIPDLESFEEASFVQGPASLRWDHYFAQIQDTLDSGKGVIVLVPEIRKLDRVARDLEARFGPVCILHSDLKGTVRRENWLKLLRGDVMLGVGTRGAVFGPVRDLGLIIVDEEESHSYKSEEFPGYNAVTVARIRARLQNCKVLLGSFAPSVRTRYFLEQGRLNQAAQVSPEDGTITVNHQIISMLGRKRGLAISKELHLALRDIFAQGERAVLFLNRRGTSSGLMCCDCGNIIMCPRCSVSLAYHARETLMVCHTCGLRQKPPLECPVCRGFTWRQIGYGIDRVASEFSKRFPRVPILKLDQDTEAPDHVIAQFASLTPSCLLCTQMVLGFEVPPVTGVGVVSCDNLLSFPDYSAPEQVFRLLMDLMHLLKSSGGNPHKQFIVQTLNPEHHAIKGIQNPEIFYTTEADNRAILGYPPFGALFKIEFSGEKQDRVKLLAEEFAAQVENCAAGIRVLGPGPAPKPRVRGRYRWILILKAAKRETLSQVVTQLWPGVSHPQVRMTVDTEEPFGIG